MGANGDHSDNGLVVGLQLRLVGRPRFFGMEMVGATELENDVGNDDHATAVDRPVGMPVPNCLNFFLVVLVTVSAIGMLWIGSRAQSWYGVATVSVLYSYLMLSNYALLHEGTHLNLNDDPKWNYWLGVVTGIFFLAPFSMIRVTHQGHHQRNRTDDEMFDLYYEGGWFLKCCQWYATLLGLFWPCIPVCAVLFALCPRAIGLQLFSGPPFGNANVKDITARDLDRIRFELLLTVAVFSTLFWFLDLQWWTVLVCYACFSVNWSTRQYVGHAFSKRDIVEGAFNLRHNFVMSKILLHGEWDLTHHRSPEVSWYYLPRISRQDEPRSSYFRHYWRQWLGPRLATEPPPEPIVDIAATNAASRMVSSQRSANLRSS